MGHDRVFLMLGIFYIFIFLINGIDVYMCENSLSCTLKNFFASIRFKGQGVAGRIRRMLGTERRTSKPSQDSQVFRLVPSPSIFRHVLFVPSEQVKSGSSHEFWIHHLASRL